MDKQGPGLLRALWLLFTEKGEDKQWLESDCREAERLDLEKQARSEAGLIDPVEGHSAGAHRRASTPGRPIVLAGGQEDDVQVDSSGR
jgi:hypothetical protein